MTKSSHTAGHVYGHNRYSGKRKWAQVAENAVELSKKMDAAERRRNRRGSPKAHKRRLSRVISAYAELKLTSHRIVLSAGCVAVSLVKAGYERVALPEHVRNIPTTDPDFHTGLLDIPDALHDVCHHCHADNIWLMVRRATPEGKIYRSVVMHCLNLQCLRSRIVVRESEVRGRTAHP